MIDDIATAILTRYNETPAGDSLRALNTGGLWFSQADQDVSSPYSVFAWNGSNIDEICGGQSDRLETANITVAIFSSNDDGGAEVFSIADAFMSHFDWCTLDYGASGYSHLACKRISVVNRGKRDNIWSVEIDYEIMYSH